MSNYSKDKYDLLKYKFPGSENIIENYSQTYQDMFVLTMLNGKTISFVLTGATVSEGIYTCIYNE